MAVNELAGFLKYKDENGDINLLMPITNVDNVDGMDDIESALNETVRFTEQTLTDEQKAQVRANIGVAQPDMNAGEGEPGHILNSSDYAKTTDIPTKTSELTNDSGYLAHDEVLGENNTLKKEVLPEGYPYEMIEELEGEFDGDYTKWEYIESSRSSSSPCFYINYAKVSNKTFTMDELNDAEFATSVGYIGFADSSNTTDHGSYISIGHPAMVDKDVIVIVHEPCEYDGAYLTTGTWFGCSSYNNDWVEYISCLPYFDKKTTVTMDLKYLPSNYMPYLISPNGTKYMLTVDDNGTLSATAVT